MDAKTWNALRLKVQSRFFRQIMDEIRYSENSLKDIAKFDISLLTTEEQKIISDYSYNATMGEIQVQSRYSQWLTLFLENGKPDWMKNGDWEHLVSLDVQHQEKAALLSLLESERQMLEGKKELFNMLRDCLVGLIVRHTLDIEKPAIISEQEWSELKLLEKSLKAIDGMGHPSQ